MGKLTEWLAIAIPGSIGNAICFLNTDTGFISGHGEIYRTTNGGTSWTTLVTGVDFTDYFFINPSVGIAAASDEASSRSIWRTTNGGLEWSNVFSKESFVINAVWMTDENMAWAAGYFESFGRGDFPVINHNTDAGATWETVYLNDEVVSRKGEQLLDIRFKNEQEGFAVSTYSQSVITSNGGLTWNFTHDESGQEIIPDWGIYKILDGYSVMYLMGRKGYVTKWE